MKKIVFITNSISYGGAAKMLCFIAESIATIGHEVTIINLKNTGDKSGYIRSIDKKINLKQVDSNKRINQILDIYKISKEFKADTIVGFTSFPNIYAVIVGKMLHIPSIISERGDPSKTTGNSKIKDKIANWIINLSAGGVFQTEGAMQFFGKKLQKRSIVIPNPIFVDDNVTRSCNKRNNTVVSVGRFDNYQKRYDVMLKSFKIFSENHPEYKLKLYGSGPDELYIKTLACDLQIQNKIVFEGVSAKPMEEIVNEGMFIITSDFEGISNSLLEAMAIGMPCVSTDHSPGGARLLIQDHVNGLLAPVGDEISLARAMNEFADNEELANKCGKNAELVKVRFSPEIIIKQWNNYICSL